LRGTVLLVAVFTAIMFTGLGFATLGLIAFAFTPFVGFVTLMFTAFCLAMIFAALGFPMFLSPLRFAVLLTALLVPHGFTMFSALVRPVLAVVLHGLMAIDQSAVVDHDAPDRVRMNVDRPVAPGAMPRRVVDDHDALVPGDPVIAPAPRTIRNAQGYAK